MGKANPQNEGELWLHFAEKMKPYGHFSRVESHETANGIPDIDFCIEGTESHIELKFNNGSRVKKDFIRPSQVRWFRRRIKAGGHPWLFALFLVGGTRYYMLFDDIEDIYGAKNYTTWKACAFKYWRYEMNWDELASIISTN